MNVLKFFTKRNEQHQKISDDLSSLLDSARKLYLESESLKKIIINQKESVERSGAASHEISSMAEMTENISQKLNQKAKNSHNAVLESSKDLEELKKMIVEVNHTSNLLKQSVNDGLKSIGSITETMNEIREKSKMINEIVFQTKLLSFNASVEAARAGEAGKGFAVVAEEMGNLAKASGEAAKEIETILNRGVEKTKEQIQFVSKDLEKVTEQTIHRVDLVSKKTENISQHFKTLSLLSKETEENTQEITQASIEQNLGVQEIATAISSLEKIATNLEAMSERNHSESSHLASKIELINEQYINFLETLSLKLTPTKKQFDFDSALKTHVDWKMKLTKYLENPNGSLEESKVCVDNACPLGQWIYGEGSRYRNNHLITFDALKKSHTEFHKCAGDIIRYINNDNRTMANQLLSAQGKYSVISETTIELLKKLKSEIQDS